MVRVRGFVAFAQFLPYSLLLPLLLLGPGISTPVHAQGVGINGSGAAADTSAILDLASTSKGFLPPRMVQAQRLAIVLPANGLVVYQTDGQAGLYYNLGTPLAPSWKLVADAGSLSGGPWQANGSNIYYSLGNVGIQRTSPVARLDVLGGNWDVVNGEGDLRIGDGTTRLKIGVATGGGGTGAATIMEQGPVGAYNVLSLGTQGNKVLHVVGTTQRVGIGTDAPSAPLGFPATLGKKITLYPGAGADYGIGIASGRLQIYTDSPGADVALGYETGGVFQERFAVKQTGALAVLGNTGSPGQVLQSNGSNAATWTTLPSDYNSWYQVFTSNYITITASSAETPLPGMFQSFSTTGTAHVVVNVNMPVIHEGCFGCGSTRARMNIKVDGVVRRRYILDLQNDQASAFTPTLLVTVGPGVHSVQLFAEPAVGPDQQWSFPVEYSGSMLIHVVPQ